MRRLKRIGFFLYSCLLLGLGFYAHIEYLDFFYPGRSLPERRAETADPPAGTVLQTSVGQNTVRADAEFVIRIRDLNTGTQTQQSERIPEQYVGMDREQFLVCARLLQEAPSLEDRRAGLVSVEVLSFSPQKILLQKSYQKKPEQQIFYLMLVKNRVVVYEQDRTTVYLETRIDGRRLPDEIQKKILDGMCVDSYGELEKFLVSYGSS